MRLSFVFAGGLLLLLSLASISALAVDQKGSTIRPRVYSTTTNKNCEEEDGAGAMLRKNEFLVQEDACNPVPPKQRMKAILPDGTGIPVTSFRIHCGSTTTTARLELYHNDQNDCSGSYDVVEELIGETAVSLVCFSAEEEDNHSFRIACPAIGSVGISSRDRGPGSGGLIGGGAPGSGGPIGGGAPGNGGLVGINPGVPPK